MYREVERYCVDGATQLQPKLKPPAIAVASTLDRERVFQVITQVRRLLRHFTCWNTVLAPLGAANWRYRRR